MQAQMNRYETSADFDADMDRLIKLAEQMDQLIRSKAFVSHAVETDSNFLTNTRTTLRNLQTAVFNVRVKLDEHYVECAKAE